MKSIRRFIVDFLVLFISIFLVGCPSVGSEPEVLVSSIVTRPIPSESKLITNVSDTNIRLAFGMGMSLPYNTWTPWEIKNSNPVIFSIIADKGKTYTVNSDDSYDGSTTNSGKTYSGDIFVGVYLNNGERVSGWDREIDLGYTYGKSFSVTSTQEVFIAVVPYNTSSYGSFGIKVSSTEAVNPDQSFKWYKNGEVISGATDYTYSFNPSLLTSGNNNFTVVGKRGGVIFSETYTVTK